MCSNAAMPLRPAMCRFVIPISLLVIAGCGPANNHQALLGAMLSCNDEVCSILESIHDPDSARAAAPRISAQAKKYREYGNRFLLLGLPDATETQRLIDELKERDQQIKQREAQARKNLSQTNPETQFATLAALSEFTTAQSDFMVKRGRMQMAKAMGKPTSTGDPAEIQQHAQVLSSIANRLTNITAHVAAMTDSESAKRQVGPLEEAVAALKSDVDQFRALPPIRDVQQQIRLDPEKQRLNDALKEYTRAAEAAKQRRDVMGQLIPLDIRVTQAVFDLDAPRIPDRALQNAPKFSPPESPCARKAREMMEAARKGRPAPPSLQPRKP